MVRKIIAILIVCATLLTFASSSYTQFDGEDLPDEPYESNKVVIKYKENLSPQALQFNVDLREQKRSSFFGSISLFFSNIGYTLRRENKPETSLSTLLSADEAVGAIERERLFEGGPSQDRNVYVITLDGSKTVEEAIKIYEALDEVEYAEPSIIYIPFEEL